MPGGVTHPARPWLGLAVFAEGGDSPTVRLLAKSHANLLRRWAET